MRNQNLLDRIRVGQVITAELLNDISGAINDNTVALAGPRTVEDGSEGINSDADGGETQLGDEVFDSTSGTETTVTITDSNSDTHDIERVDTIVFTEQTSGRTITLNITYPL